MIFIGDLPQFSRRSPLHLTSIHPSPAELRGKVGAQALQVLHLLEMSCLRGCHGSYFPYRAGRFTNIIWLVVDLPLWKNMSSSVSTPSEKYEFVSWGDEIPNWMESHEKFHGSSHHQALIQHLPLSNSSASYVNIPAPWMSLLPAWEKPWNNRYETHESLAFWQLWSHQSQHPCQEQVQTYCGWLRNPNHQLIDGKHRIIYRVSTILLVVQDFATIHSM